MPNLFFRFDVIIIILILRFVNTLTLIFRIIFREDYLMDFADNLKRICAMRGTNPTALCKELGLSTSKVSAWYKGSLPKQEVMVQLAQILECSVMDFFADEDDLHQPQAKDEDEEDILRVYRGLSRRMKHEFMSMVYEFENRQELEGDKDSTAAV